MTIDPVTLCRIVPECYQHLSRQERVDGAAQMLADLERLARQDGCIAAAWALEMLAAAAPDPIVNTKRT